MISLVIPISASKAYCFGDCARGIFELDCPKEELYIVFSVDASKGVRSVLSKVRTFKEHWPYPKNVFTVKVDCKGNDPNNTDNMTWQKRSEVAATLRNKAIHFVRDGLVDVTHIFFVGSDIGLEPHSLKDMLGTNHDLVSGLYLTRVGHKPCAFTWDSKTLAIAPYPVELWKKEPFTVDWCGLDCVLISKKIFDVIDFDDFTVEKYNQNGTEGIADDGYFYFETFLRLGIKPTIHSNVRPLHIDERGRAFAARMTPQIGYEDVCPKCGEKTTQKTT